MSLGIRQDLLELTSEALIALANAGFVKKGLKELEKGNIPAIEEDADGVVRARFDDGTLTTLAPAATLKEAQCSCPASGICRHRVMLVQAYQRLARETRGMPASNPQDSEPGWTPATFSDADLERVIGAAGLAQARRLAQAQPVASLLPWSHESAVPTARFALCTVRFFSRSSLAHARCDCQAGGGCAHVALAVWGFRQLAELGTMAETTLGITASGQPEPASGPQIPILASAAAAAFLEDLHRWRETIWSEGATEALIALSGATGELLRKCGELDWRWVTEEIRLVWGLLAARQARSNRFDPRQLLLALAGIEARISAAGYLAERPAQEQRIPVAALLGIGEPGEQRLDRLRLVSLGLDLWQDDRGFGAAIVYVDQDTQTLLLLERYWEHGNDPGLSQPDPLKRRIVGKSVRQLAAGQLVTSQALRRANGCVDLGADRNKSTLFPLSASSWDSIATPLKQERVAGLRCHLVNALPRFAGPVHTLGNFHLFAPPQLVVRNWWWDASCQSINALLDSGRDNDEPLLLRMPHNGMAPGASDAMAELLGGTGTLRSVAGEAFLEQGRVVMRPLAVMTDQGAVVLQAAEAKKQSLPPLQSADAPDMLHLLTGNALTLLEQWLQRGLKHLGVAEMSRCRDLARQLRQCGLSLCGEAMEQLAREVPENGPSDQRLTSLILLLHELHSKGIDSAQRPAPGEEKDE